MRSVFYLMSGRAHLPYLLTSLYTLRLHWSGPVAVYAWEESFDAAAAITSDLRCRASVWLRRPEYRGKNDQFLDKILLAKQLSTSPNLYLDADTLVVGSLGRLFALAEQCGFVATQFNDWTTDGTIVKNRIAKLCPFPEISDELINEVIVNSYPSVNGGVFCSQPTSPVLPLWHRWSSAARSIFIADECVLHLMVPQFEPTGQLAVLEGYNTSPKFGLPAEPVRIWHGHGDSFVRPKKSPRGCALWRAVFDECLALNVGGVNGWWRQCGNAFLQQFMSEETVT